MYWKSICPPRHSVTQCCAVVYAKGLLFHIFPSYGQQGQSTYGGGYGSAYGGTGGYQNTSGYASGYSSGGYGGVGISYLYGSSRYIWVGIRRQQMLVNPRCIGICRGKQIKLYIYEFHFFATKYKTLLHIYWP